MRILLIGGNGFIGLPLTRELSGTGHEVAILHRRAATNSLGAGVVEIQADRNQLSDYRSDLQRFSPDVIVDLILSSGEQTRQLMNVSRELTAHVVALSSMDVYRAWGVMLGTEPGPLEPLPILEDSPLRTARRFYSPETVKMLQGIFTWLDERYDKIAVEEAIMNATGVRGTVLRLPMVYGPRDPLHRFFPLMKRCADGRSSIILCNEFAAWRGPRGYVENVAHAIVLAATSDRASGRVYNVCEEPVLPELEWQTRIAKQMGWPGKFVLLPREKTPKHLLQPGNAAQQVVASSQRIRTDLLYEEPVEIEEAIRRTIAWEQRNPPGVINPEQFDYESEDAALTDTA